MNKKFLSLLLLLVTLMLVTACGGASGDGENEEVQATSADEHEDEHEDAAEHIHVDPPEEFASLANPEADHEEAIAAGEELFKIHCVTCHGPAGEGDGEGAVNLDPKPANLADSAMMANMSDGYLFWRISKGGAFEPFNSAMPSWEQSFTEEQRWQLVSFVRTLGADDHHDDEMHDENEAEHLEEDDHHEGEDQHESEEQHIEEEQMEGDEYSD